MQKIKHIILIILFFLMGAISTFAQNEVNIWYFGYKAGLDFNEEIPRVVLNSDMDAHEGSASICDVNGNLLFYSNGETIWNREHKPLPNGSSLRGALSSSQSCIFVPKPRSNNIFYLFTIDDTNGEFGFRYSEIDLNLDNGMGDIKPGKKNRPILSSVSEKITAVKNSDNQSIWVIVHEYLDNTFYSYLIDDNGFDKSNVKTSNIGTAHTPASGEIGNPEAALGCMKMSQLGNKLAVAIQYRDIFEVFDFNKTTGIISNHIIVSDNNIGPYGVEFSANEQFLYGSSRQSDKIFQWNLEAPDIKASIQIVGNTLSANGSLQIAPDGKIYSATLKSNYLGVINNPDRQNCNFDARGLYLEGRLSSEGLPNMISSAPFQPVFDITNYCLGDITSFSMINTLDVDSVKWNFNFPETSNNNFSYNYETNHIYNLPGIKQIELISSRFGQLDTVIQKIEVFSYPTVNFSIDIDTASCANQTLLLDGGDSAMRSYLWSDGSTERYLEVLNNGEYYVDVNEKNCISHNSINVTIHEEPQIEFLEVLPSDCRTNNGRIEMQITGGGGNYEIMWNEGDTTTILENLNAGYYSVYVNDSNGCFGYADTVVNNLGAPEINIQSSKEIICYGDTIILSAGDNDDYEYLWSNDSTSREIVIAATESVDYWVIGTDPALNCSTVEVFPLDVNPNPVPDINILQKREACKGDEIILDAGNEDYSYLWSTRERDSEIIVESTGIYSVRVSDTTNCYSDYNIDITFHSNPRINLGKERAICIGDTIELNAGTWEEYTWNTGDSDSIKQVYATGTYRVIVSDTNYCEGRSEVSIWANDPNNLLIDSVARNEITCDGESDAGLKIYAEGSWKKLLYSVDGGLNFEDNNGIFKNLSSGVDYIVAVKEEGACTKVGENYIFSDPPFMYIDSSILLPSCEDCNDGIIRVIPSGGVPPYSYTWSDYYATPERTDLYPGQYTVQVGDANNCNKFFTTDLGFGNDFLYIPNAFTPNADGINDEWIFGKLDKYLEIYPNIQVKVFDKAGKLVFESPIGYPQPWKGSYSGVVLPTNTYYYIVDLGADVKPLSGTVTIIL